MAIGRQQQKGEAQAALLTFSVAVVLLLGGLAGWLFLFAGGESDGPGVPIPANGSGAAADPERAHPPDPASINHDTETEPGAKVDRQSREGPVEIGGRTFFLIEGQVRDLESDAPAYGCEVYLIPASEEDPLQALTSYQLHRVMDPEGWFQVTVEDPGSYHLVVRSVEHQDLVRRILVPDASPLDLRLVRGTWMSGRVLGPQGQPAPRVTVWLHRQRALPEGSLESRGRATTDEEGRFAFYRLEPGTYRLTVGNPSAPLVVEEDLRLESAQRLEPVLALPNTSTLLVFVTGDDTRPLEGARVTLTNSKDEVVRTALTDAEGTCRIGPIQEGTHRLTIQADGHAPLEEELHLTTHSAETSLRRRLRR